MNIINQGIFTLEINGNVACMNFNPDDSKYTHELIESSYTRECKFIDKISKYNWAPQNVQINEPNRKIYFSWHGNTGEDMLPDRWKAQLEQIAIDLHSERIYKPNFYPKCFYTDSNNQLHSYIFYSSSSYDEQPIGIDFYKPILNDDRLELITKLETNGMLDMKILIEHAFTDYIKWPDDYLREIYNRVLKT